MEFKHFIFQAWKVMELNCQSLKVMETFCLIDSLLKMTGQGQSKIKDNN